MNGYVARLSETEKVRLNKYSRVLRVEPNQLIEIEGDQTSPPSCG
ncbi:MAG: hypothetical protein ACKOEH_10375 [Actinomycetota bacterium]